MLAVRRYDALSPMNQMEPSTMPHVIPRRTVASPLKTAVQDQQGTIRTMSLTSIRHQAAAPTRGVRPDIYSLKWKIAMQLAGVRIPNE